MRTSPSDSGRDLRSRLEGERFVLPPLTVQDFTCWQAYYKGRESTLYRYTFVTADRWYVEYTGQFHFHWHKGATILLLATIKKQAVKWKCTKIARPVQQWQGEVPLFGEG